MGRAAQIVLSLLVAAAAGAGATTYLSEKPRSLAEPSVEAGDPSAAERKVGPDYGAQIAEISSELADERAARTRLAEEVASLKNQLARVHAMQPTSLPAGDEAAKRGHDDEAEATKGPRPLDVDALIAAGFSETTVREYKASLDQMELDRLYLRDIATREGWINTARFREESEALRLEVSDTREKYGEDFYDWMLYTTGHDNRVQVGSVMGGSAAEDVGLREGDQVVSYGGERVFNPSELRDATTAGDPGELVPVEVIRNGRAVRVMVPRGPLGVRVEQASVEPRRAS